MFPLNLSSTTFSTSIDSESITNHFSRISLCLPYVFPPSIIFKALVCANANTFFLISQATGTRAAADEATQGNTQSNYEPNPPDNIAFIVTRPFLLLHQRSLLFSGRRLDDDSAAEGPMAISSSDHQTQTTQRRRFVFPWRKSLLLRYDRDGGFRGNRSWSVIRMMNVGVDCTVEQ